MATAKGKMLESLIEHAIKGEIANVIENVTEDIQWNIISKAPVIGKDMFTKQLNTMKMNQYSDLTIKNIITHGISAAVDGTVNVTNQDGDIRIVSFCHLVRFNKFKDGIVKEITSYIM